MFIELHVERDFISFFFALLQSGRCHINNHKSIKALSAHCNSINNHKNIAQNTAKETQKAGSDDMKCTLKFV